MAYPTSRAEAQAEIERAAAERLEQQRQADEEARQRVTEAQATWKQRRTAQLDAERKHRDAEAATRLESELRRRYVAAGGSVDDFDADLPELLRQHFRDVALGKASPVAETDDLADPRRWGLA